MKKTAFVLAMLIALPGTAFAGETAKASVNTAPAPCIATTVKDNLDCAATGSVEKAHPAVDTTITGGKKLGLDISPWSMTNGF